MIDPAARPLLAALQHAEDAFEAELARTLTAWERALAIPPKGPEALARVIAQRLLAMMERALVIQRQGWRETEAKDVNTFEAARVDYARTRAADLVVAVTDETRARIRAIVAEGTARGLNADGIRREIATLVDGIAGRSPKQRAAVIARTELHNAATWAQEQEALALRRRGADLVKVWTATMDRRTRPAHRRANGQVREIEQDFNVGGRAMRRPGDPRGGPENTIQCRCIARHIPRRQVADDRQRRARDMAPALTARAGKVAALDPRALELDAALAAAVVSEAARLNPGVPLAAPRIDGAIPRLPQIAGHDWTVARDERGPAAFLTPAGASIVWEELVAAWAAAFEERSP